MWPRNYEELSKLSSALRLTKDFPTCEEKDCKYIAKNTSGDDIIRIKLDEDIPPQREGDKRIDYLFLNETKKIAYLVELKRSNVKKAFDQLENTDASLREILTGYKRRWRIVCNSRTAHLENNDIKRRRRAIINRGIDLQIKSRLFEEDISTA